MNDSQAHLLFTAQTMFFYTHVCCYSLMAHLLFTAQTMIVKHIYY